MRRGFLHHEGGNVVLFTAAVVPVLAVAAGFAVDHATLLRTHDSLQNAADAAALAGAREMSVYAGPSASQREAAAKDAAAKHVTSLVPDASYSVEPSAPNGTVDVTLTTVQPVAFGGLFGRPSRTVTAEATATYMGQRPSGCLIALSPAEHIGIKMQGAAKVAASNCGIWSNAAGPSAIHMHGAPSMQGRVVCAEHSSGNATNRISPELRSDCGLAPDPFASVPLGQSYSCDYTDYAFPKHAKSADLSPGVYCGGLEIDIDVQLSPGLFVFKDGVLLLKGNARVAGAGVSLLMTGDGAGLQMQGNPDLTLTAPDSGALAGIAVAVADTKGAAPTSELQGSPRLTVEGSVYMPGQQLVMQGNPQISITGTASKLVASSFDLQGSPDLTVQANDTQIKSADLSSLRIMK